MKIEKTTFDMAIVPAIYLGLGVFCGNSKIISYFPNTKSSGILASSVLSSITALASAKIFDEDDVKRRTSVILTSALSSIFIPFIAKKLQGIEAPSGYGNFFAVQAIAFTVMENFRETDWIGEQPQDCVETPS